MWLGLGLVAALQGRAFSQSVRLNGSLAQPRAGDVQGYALSSDGAHVVYLADQEGDDRFELYSAPSNGSVPPVKLNAPLPANADVAAFALGSGHAIYLADQGLPGVQQLFSVPLDASAAPIRLDPPLAGPPGEVSRALVSPDGGRVLFSLLDPTAGLERIYSAPMDGSQPALQIADSGQPGGISDQSVILELAFTADSQRALFLAETFGAIPVTLFQVPVDGSQPALEIGTGLDDVTSFAVSQDSSRVVFEEGYNRQQILYSAALDGSLRVPLNTPETLVEQFHVAPDGSRIVFFEGPAQTNPSFQLVSIASNGTQRIEIGPAQSLPDELQISPDWSRLAFIRAGRLYGAALQSPDQDSLAGPNIGPGLAISADSTTVVFTRSTAGFRGLYSMPIDGGAATLLNGPAHPGRGVALEGQALALEGPRVVYRQERDSDEAIELFSVLLEDGLPEVRLNAALTGARDVRSFLVAPGGARVVFLADQHDDETFELFGAPLAGGAAPVRYNLPLPGGPVRGDVLAFQSAARAGRVVYRADQDDDDLFELYSAHLDASGEPRRLAAPLASAGYVTASFAVSADGERVAFEHRSNGAPAVTLYSVSVLGTLGDPVALDGAYTFLAPFAFGAADTRVVYRRQTTGFASFLFSAPVDGSAPPITLHPSAHPSSSVAEFQLGPDGALAVFRADHRLLGVVELYSAPVDGSAPARKLCADLAGNADVSAFRIAPDGQYVVYLADQEIDEQFALFSVPIDASSGGASAPERLNDALVAGGDVTDFQITSDGRGVVYRADQHSDSAFRLYRVPIEGRRPPRGRPGGTLRTDAILLTPMDQGRSVRADFALSADGTQVLYRADAGLAGVIELFRASTDGSGAPVALNPPLVVGGDVLAFQLAPDQQRVVYLADERTNDVIELFSVPLAGGPSIALDTMPVNGDVETFQIAPDSRFVAYRADRHMNGVIELFAAPLDASAGARKLNAPLATGGDVASDFVPLSGGRVLYRADQAAVGVMELFAGFFAHALPMPGF